MKIAYLFTYGYSLTTWKNSGTLDKELRVFRKLHEKYGFKFKLFTYGDDKDLLIRIDEEIFEVFPIYTFTTLYNLKVLNYIKSFYLPFLISKEFKDVSLIKQNQLQGVWVSVILKFILKKPLYTRTGYDVLKFSRHSKNSYLKIFIYYLLTQIAIISSNIYSVTSNSDYIFLRKYFFGTKNIMIRPNWIENNRTTDLDMRIKNKVISVGRLEKQKNYKKLISIFEGSNFEIDIAGEGSLKTELENFAKIKGVKVNFIGRLENQDILKLLNDYLFYFSTSDYEGNPKSVLEAMSCGCIVFLSNIENHKELVSNGINGYILEYPFEINTLLNEILDDSTKISNISDNSLSSIVDNNSLEILTTKLYGDFIALIDC